MGGFDKVEALLPLAAIAFCLTVALIGWRAQRLVWGKPVGTEGWINRAAHRWFGLIKQQKSAAAERKAQAAEQAERAAKAAKVQREIAAIRAMGNRPPPIIHEAPIEPSVLDEDDWDDEDEDPEEEDPESDVRWLEDRAFKQQFARPGFAEAGKWARFEYVDADGVITNRNIVNWDRRGPYIVGFDRSKGEVRTFRQDRIDNWVCG